MTSYPKIPADTNTNSPLPELPMEVLRLWVNNTVGFWHIDTCRKELQLKPGGKAWSQLSTMLQRLKQDSVIVPVKAKGEGWWRLVESELTEMAWTEADETAKLNLQFPFELERYMKLLPKSIAVLAGTSDAGKTAYLMDFAQLNLDKGMDVHYFNSEMSPEEFKLRFMAFGIPPEAVPPNFHAYERYENFGDVIFPNAINIVDYVDVPEGGEFWKIGNEIDSIHRHLNRGMAFCAIQKKYNTKNYQGKEVKFELGYGAEQTIKKARLYLVMDRGSLLIKKAKLWLDPTRNPNGMRWSFSLRKGAEFFNVNLVDQPGYVQAKGDEWIPKEKDEDAMI